MKNATFFVLRKNQKGKYYKASVSGVEFILLDQRILAYIDENIHRIFFIDPGTGISFAGYTFPFERKFNKERHLCRAPLYLDNNLLMGYVKFMSLGGDTEEKQHYEKLSDFFLGLEAMEEHR